METPREDNQDIYTAALAIAVMATLTTIAGCDKKAPPLEIKDGQGHVVLLDKDGRPLLDENAELARIREKILGIIGSRRCGEIPDSLLAPLITARDTIFLEHGLIGRPEEIQVCPYGQPEVRFKVDPDECPADICAIEGGTAKAKRYPFYRTTRPTRGETAHPLRAARGR